MYVRRIDVLAEPDKPSMQGLGGQVCNGLGTLVPNNLDAKIVRKRNKRYQWSNDEQITIQGAHTSAFSPKDNIHRHATSRMHNVESMRGNENIVSIKR